MRNKEDAARFARFLLVGAASTVAYFTLLLLFRDAVPNTALLAGICYVLCMAVNYASQSMFTFRSKGPTNKAVTRFTIMHAGALVFNSLTMWALVDFAALPLLLSQFLITGTIAVATFLVSKLWVYV